MSVTVTARGAVGTATGTTTVTMSPTSTLPAGSLGVLCLAYDNSGASGADPYSSIATDSAGNVWTTRANGLADPGAASAGATIRIFTAPITTALTSGGTVVVTFSASTSAKAYAFWSVTDSTGALPIFLNGGGGSASTTTPTVTTGGTVPSSVLYGDDVVIGAAALEGADSWTGDADTTRGSWSTKQSAAQGTGATGMSVCTQSKVVTQGTAVGTQTYNPTNTSGDCVAAYVTLSAAHYAMASADDATEDNTTAMTLVQNGFQISTGAPAAEQLWGGIRFTTVNIPVGATILSATLE